MEARTHPALMDPEVGLPNRLHFDLVHGYLFYAGERGLPFTVMMVSTGLGEGAPVEEVRRIGQHVQEVARTADVVTHLDNGRYLLLLSGTNSSGARVAADRVEGAIGDVVPGQISFGLATYDRAVKDPQTLVDSAGGALDAAEAAGGGVQFA